MLARKKQRRPVIQTGGHLYIESDFPIQSVTLTPTHDKQLKREHKKMNHHQYEKML